MMKKLTLLFVFAAAAMSLQARSFEWGIRAGVNVSSLGEFDLPIAEREDSGLEGKPGIYAGLFGQFRVSGNWAIETGLFYAQMGGRNKENDRNEAYKVTADPAYLQLPVSVFYRFNLTDRFSLYPSLGVYAGYGLSGNMTVEGTVNSEDVGMKADYFDKFAERLDLGVTAGANARYGRFILGLHYDQGITRVNKTKVPYGDNALNSNFRAALSFVF